MKNFESLRVPKYVQLMISLREQIESGQLKAGEHLPTREKLMKEFGLSLSTVTRAISELERQGWLVSRQGSGTFVSKRLDSTKDTGKDKTTIGLLVPITRKELRDFVKEFVDEAIEHHFNILTMYAPNDEEYELNQGRLLLEKQVDAVVWFPVEPKRHVSVASIFRKNQIPVVIGEKVMDTFTPPWMCVRSDYYGGTISALQQLLAKGHTRISYIGPKGSESGFGPTTEKWNAYKDFMKEQNLWNPDELVFHPTLFKEWPAHVSKLESIFQRKQSPTALIAYDDTTALESMRGLQSIGLNIPEDIEIIGHGDCTSGHYSTPRLSTLSPCWAEFVDQLFRILQNELSESDQKQEQKEREIIIPQRLIVRESATQSADEIMTATP